MIIARDYQQESADKAIDFMRATDEPGILVLTTAAGKSIIATIIAKVVNNAKKRVLILAPSGDLVEQNAQKYKDAGGDCSIYSASLGKKHTGHLVVFGTPISVANGLDDFDAEYALVIVDECDLVNEDEQTTYQKIFAHIKKNNPRARFLGLTATPMKGREKLVGKDKTFKHIIHDLPHNKLCELGWVTKYKLGHVSEHYHLQDVKVQTNGKFKQSDIDDETLGKERLTRAIVSDMIATMDADNRKCAFIFASSIKHAEEILSYLPTGILITGKTPKPKRRELLREVRRGLHRYVVNVGTLTVGVDAPIVDTIVLARASESLRLLLQIFGRGCRLHDPSWSLPPGEMNWLHDAYVGKRDCMILDHGENIERFSLDDDITIAGLIDAKGKQDEEEDDFFKIDCPECGAENRHTSQRCVGVIDGARCNFRFVYKLCEQCDTQNSPSARYCRKCSCELINPEDKLTRRASVPSGQPFFVQVLDMSLQKHQTQNGDSLRVSYQVTDGEKKWAVSEFQRPGHENPFHRKRWHYFAEDTGAIGNTIENVLLEAGSLKVPSRLLVKKPKGKKYYEIEARHS